LVGQYTSLVVVSGKPSISYYDQTNGDLKYARASNIDGTIWGVLGILDGDDGSNVGQYSSMAVVNGNPAVSYFGSLRFVRSLVPTALTLQSAAANGSNQVIFWLVGVLLLGMTLIVWNKQVNKTKGRGHASRL
jgi:hypothetical protein